MLTLQQAPSPGSVHPWQDCRFLTCSVLPVRFACNLTCPFCFSKLIARGRDYFSEIACFTNGTFLTVATARRLKEAGLSYLCYSRHHENDEECRRLMGAQAPTLDAFFAAAAGLKIRATCVMAKGFVDRAESVERYIAALARFGVTEFTFKHTYVAYEQSVFAAAAENRWAREHQVQLDPFANQGEPVARLPWGPVIRKIGPYQVCFYFEPHPSWEKEHRLCRSVNLLSDGSVYASLEDHQSLLYRLNSW